MSRGATAVGRVGLLKSLCGRSTFPRLTTLRGWRKGVAAEEGGARRAVRPSGPGRRPGSRRSPSGLFSPAGCALSFTPVVAPPLTKGGARRTPARREEPRRRLRGPDQPRVVVQVDGLPPPPPASASATRAAGVGVNAPASRASRKGCRRRRRLISPPCARVAFCVRRRRLSPARRGRCGARRRR